MLIDDPKTLDWALLRSRLAQLPSGFDARTERSIEPHHASQQSSALNNDGSKYFEEYKASGNHEDLDNALNCFLQAQALDQKENDAIGQAHSLFNYANICKEAGIARQGIPMIEKALGVYAQHDMQDMIFLGVNVLYGALVDELDHLIREKSPDKTAVEDIRGKMKIARETSAQLFYHQRGEAIEPSAHSIKQGQVGFSADAPIGTDSVNECVCVIVYDPATKKTALAHIDYNIPAQSLNTILDNMPEGQLQARIVGGRFRYENHPRAGQSRSNIEKVSKFLEQNGVEILSADLLEYEQPTSITVYPDTFEIREASPNMRHADDNLSNGKLMLALDLDQPLRELRIAFDLTASDKYAPQLLSHDQIVGLRKHFLFQREEQIYKKVDDPAVVDWILHLNTAYTTALNHLHTAVDETVAARRKDGLVVDDKDVERCKYILNFREIHVGQEANSLNQPITDLIKESFFTPKDGKCVLNMASLHDVVFSSQPFDALKDQSASNPVVPLKSGYRLASNPGT